MKHPMLLCDADERYRERLAAGLNRIEPFPWTVRTGGADALEHMAAEEAVLLDEALFSEAVSERFRGRLVCLSETAGYLSRAGCPAVCRFQTLERIASEIEKALGAPGADPEAETAKRRLFAVQSPEGGEGAFAFSLALALLLSGTEKTLFVSLDAFSPLRPAGEALGLSELLYCGCGGAPQALPDRPLFRIRGLDVLLPASVPEDVFSTPADLLSETVLALFDGGGYASAVFSLGASYGVAKRLFPRLSGLFMPVFGATPEKTLPSALKHYQEWVLRQSGGRVAAERICLPEGVSPAEVLNAPESLLFTEFGSAARKALAERKSDGAHAEARDG